MFIELYVENLALIETATINWSGGLNVLSGETGAGKSIVIDAVGLLLGGRSHQDYIRAGCEKCFVQGVFQGPFDAVTERLLAEAGLEPFADQLILARELQNAGRSICRVNMRMVPVTFLKELACRLINIHGQMEHMLLLEPSNQLAMVDSYGGSGLMAQGEKVAEAWDKWQQNKTEWEHFVANQAQLAQKADFLKYQIKEIEAANLTSGEEEELQTERNLLQNAAKLAEAGQGAFFALTVGDKSAPLEAVGKAMQCLDKLAGMDPAMGDLAKQLQDTYYAMEDVATELRKYNENIVDDPSRLDDVEKRLETIKTLGRKYGGNIPEILAFAESIKKELDNWENYELYEKELANKLATTKAAYMQEADILTNLRRKAAKKLGENITQEIQELQMPAAHFEPRLTLAEPSRGGVDEITFFISPNPGEGFKPVAKIASAGEMSRIMLAVKVILAQTDKVPTLIFDEIDSGLGGRALASMADKLGEVAKNTQAICVTHSPLVAAYAEQHFLINKEEKEGRTVVVVKKLGQSQRETELCRMLAGDKASQTTLSQAREMLATGEIKRQNK